MNKEERNMYGSKLIEYLGGFDQAKTELRKMIDDIDADVYPEKFISVCQACGLPQEFIDVEINDIQTWISEQLHTRKKTI